MIAILTFLTTIILSVIPNNDSYDVETIKSYPGYAEQAAIVLSETERKTTSCSWFHDDSMGWVCELPEIDSNSSDA